jgi:signal transduction histidine kinase
MSEDEKHDKRLAFLGQLAAGLAHEIRNPLSTIGLNLELLQEDWEDPETEKEKRTKRKLHVLSKEVLRLQTILEDFLRFAGGHQITRAPVHLTELVDEVLEFVRPQLVEKRVNSRTMYEDDFPLLELDRDAIKQVLLNLVLNAIQAMPEGGELMVRLTIDGKSRAVVDVTDTGEGMPPEVRERVWQPYYSRRKTGTGMGLPLVRRLVEEHDGSISVVSDVGKGTRFTMKLPITGRV